MSRHVTQLLTGLLERNQNANKYDFGHVLVIGGSPGMVGAPVLAAQAAMRVGAGLVTIATSASVADAIDEHALEVMTIAIKSPLQVMRFIQARKVTVLIIGPGVAASQFELVRTIAQQVSIPVVVDAGALRAYTGHLNELKKAAESTTVIITPHPGEYNRLTSSLTPEEFAAKYQLTVVYKQHQTKVIRPDGLVYTNKTGNAGLATAGSGDVLTGMIGGLLAQHFEPFEAAEAGVWLHGKAGDISARQKTEPGMIASDVIEAIPSALKGL